MTDYMKVDRFVRGKLPIALGDSIRCQFASLASDGPCGSDLIGV
jgi:hypothetical protein